MCSYHTPALFRATIIIHLEKFSRPGFWYFWGTFWLVHIQGVCTYFKIFLDTFKTSAYSNYLSHNFINSGCVLIECMLRSAPGYTVWSKDTKDTNVWCHGTSGEHSKTTNNTADSGLWLIQCVSPHLDKRHKNALKELNKDLLWSKKMTCSWILLPYCSHVATINEHVKAASEVIELKDNRVIFFPEGHPPPNSDQYYNNGHGPGPKLPEKESSKTKSEETRLS